MRTILPAIVLGFLLILGGVIIVTTLRDEDLFPEQDETRSGQRSADQPSGDGPDPLQVVQSGRVLVAAHGAPVPAASVELLPLVAPGAGDPVVARATTDAAGAFELAVPPGRYRLRVRAEGLLTAREELRLLPGTTPAALHLELQAGARITGQVRTAGGAGGGETEGDGAAGAGIGSAWILAVEEPFFRDASLEERLRAVADPSTRERAGIPIRARSDPDGAFELQGLEERTGYRLFVAAPGHRLAELRHRVPDRGPVTFTLVPAHDLHGQVVDAIGGGPVAGAQVALHPAPEGDMVDQLIAENLPPVLEVEAAPDGRFVVPPASDRVAAHLVVTAPGFLPARLDVGPSNEATLDQPLRVTLEPGLMIEGEVNGPAGGPIAGARVVPENSSGDPLPPAGLAGPLEEGPGSAVTDAAGTFAVGPFQADTAVWLRVQHPELLTVVKGPFQPGAPAIAISLGRGETVAGRVQAAGTGEPITGATVRVRQGGDLPRSSLTDASGGFSIGGFAAGPETLLVTAEADGYGAIRRQLRRTEIGTGGILLELQRAGSIAGQVVDAGGAPLPGCRVIVHDLPVRNRAGNAAGQAAAGPATAGKERLLLETDAEGNFLAEGLAPGHYRVEALPDGLLPLSSGPVRVVAGEPSPPLRLRVVEGSRVEGMVIDPTGTPVPSAQWSVLAGRRTIDSGSCDSDGRFRSSGLPAGEYEVRAHAPGYRLSLPATVEVTGEVSAAVVLELNPPAHLSGTVRATDGSPIPGARVTVIELVTGKRHELRAGAGGQYHATDLEPYEVDVLATAEGFARTVLRNQPVNRSGVDLVLPRLGGLRGAVADARGTPVTGFQVVPLLALEGRFLPARAAESVRSARGDFELGGLDPGSYQLAVTAPGHGLAVVERLEVRADAITDAGRIVLPAATNLRGRVVAEDSGLPVPDALVELVDPAEVQFPPLPGAGAGRPAPRTAMVTGQATGGGRSRTRTDAQGRFSLGHLRASAIELRVEHPDLLVGSFEVQVVAEEVVLPLERGGILEGELVDPTGQPIEGATVLLRPSGAGPAGDASHPPGARGPESAGSKQRITGADGRFVFGGLEAGSVVLEVMALATGELDSEDPQRYRLEADAEPGAVSRVRWVLELPGEAP